MKKIIVICFMLLGCVNVYSQENYVPANPEIKPKFIGDLNKYLSEHIVYPKDAEKQEIQGIVYVSFIVEKDGSISTVKIAKGITASLDSAAVNVTRQMPKWSPSMDNGQAVRCKYDMPVHFVLPNKNAVKAKE